MLRTGAQWTAVLVAALLILTGCSSSYPADPDGTLERVTGGTLRVGVTDNGQWVQLEKANEPQGIEPELVRGFADTLDADIHWRQGSEHGLVQELKHGELDMVIGGISSDTPWTTHAGLSREYVQTTNRRGNSVKHVLLVPLGENAFLLKLDQFLMQQEVQP